MKVPVHGSMLDASDWQMLQEAVDSHWLTAGKYTKEFERALAQKFNRRNALFVNSGSSANLLAVTALELPKGSEVITCAAAFPTTVNPIVQNNLIPVFVDCEMGTWNIDTDYLDEAYSGKTKAVMVCHTLGNPVNLDAVYEFSQKHGLPVIEDCCDAAGALYHNQPVGMNAAFSTYSFYPAHQMTTGEGGAVLSNMPLLNKIAASYRDWGRACWCETGKDNTCGKRFDGEYDHKYSYDRIGYNLKATDLQAAIGVSQIKRLDEFVEKRRENWMHLRLAFTRYQEPYPPMILPMKTPGSEPSWFGFAFGVEKRNELARYLDKHEIGNRPLFAGNITRQPAYRDVPHRIVGSLTNADYVHEHVLWVGCFPGLSREQLDYTIEVLHGFDY